MKRVAPIVTCAIVLAAFWGGRRWEAARSAQAISTPISVTTPLEPNAPPKAQASIPPQATPTPFAVQSASVLAPERPQSEPPSGQAQEDTVSPTAASDERAEKLQQIRASGPDIHNMRDYAKRVGEAWSTLASKKGIKAAFEPWECHAAGCATTIIQDSPSAINELTKEISHSPEFGQWNGGKMRSGAIGRDDGTSEATWILYAPAEGEDTMITARVGDQQPHEEAH